MNYLIKVGARGSALSRAQCDELARELHQFHPEILFELTWVETTGDLDLKTSLQCLEKTDFFTKEIDALQLSGRCRISIHSAKDLPEPLPKGLALIALTKGIDPSDSIVVRDQNLPQNAKIATSSKRRAHNVKALRRDFVCVDIRGDILARLKQLDRGDFDGVVMAEAALIRLKLTHLQRIPLPGITAPLQGQLAVLARDGDDTMRELFSCIDVSLRKRENDLVSGNRPDSI